MRVLVRRLESHRFPKLFKCWCVDGSSTERLTCQPYCRRASMRGLRLLHQFLNGGFRNPNILAGCKFHCIVQWCWAMVWTGLCLLLWCIRPNELNKSFHRLCAIRTWFSGQQKGLCDISQELCRTWGESGAGVKSKVVEGPGCHGWIDHKPNRTHVLYLGICSEFLL